MPFRSTSLSSPSELQVDAARLARAVLGFCLLAEFAFVVLDYHINYGKWTETGALRRMFNIAREDSLASWFAVTQTLLIALTLWLVYAILRRSDYPRWRVTGWLVLAVFFTYMAVDDGAQIHERLGTAFKTASVAAGNSLGFFPSYTWQLLFLPLFAALGFFTLVFSWLELREGSLRTLLAAALCLLAVAVGLDFVEGLDDDHPWNAFTWLVEHYDIDPWTRARFGSSDFNTLRHFSKSIEEAVEMAANSFLWFLFLRHLPSVTGGVSLRFRRERASEK